MNLRLPTSRWLYVWLAAAVIALQGFPWLFGWFTGRALRRSPALSSSLEALVEERLQPAVLRETLSHYPHVAWLLSGITLLGILLLLTGVLLDLRWLWRRGVQGRSAGGPHRALAGGPWGTLWSLGDVGRLIILSLFISSVTSWVAGAVLVVRHHRPDPLVELLFLTAAVEGAMLWMVAVYARAKGRRWWDAVGLAGAAGWRAVGAGLRGYLTVLPLIAAALASAGWLAKLVGYTPPPHPLSVLFLEEDRLGLLLFASLFACVAGPLLEEIFFRGILFRALRARLALAPAIGVSAVLFAMLHGNWVALAPITLLGCLLAYLYERTGSLWASVLVHILHNSAMIALVWVVRLLVRLPG